MKQEGSEQHHHSHSSHEGMIADFRKRFFISLILTIPIIVLSPMLQELFGVRGQLAFWGDRYLLFFLSTIVFLYGGWPFLKGLYTELKNGRPGMMTLIGLAITVAYVYSALVVFYIPGSIFFWELATLIDIMLIGHWIEMKSVMGAGKALESLAKLMPTEAHKIMPDGSVVDVHLNTLEIGDEVLVKPGEKFPADGQVIKGESSANESMLTGESKPLVKNPGSTVIGGSINGEGSLYIKVAKLGKDSFLSQVINLVKEAEKSKSKTENIANKAAQVLTIIALTAGLLTLLLWVLFSQESFAFAIERMVTVMVITCPHALGLAIPLVVAVSTAIAAHHGLLIRNRTAFEQARHLNAIVFDKTGTLTKGQFGITDVILFESDISKNELVDYAAAIEALSEHPIARAIASSSRTKESVDKFKAIPGIGAEGMVDGKSIQVVSPGFLKEKGINIENKKIDLMNAEGKTIVYVLIDGQVKGAIALADVIRPEAKEVITQLKSMDIRCIMLTGDNVSVAKEVAAELGVDEYFAEVLPQDKVAKIKEVQKRGYIVAMTGDGVNDAPALKQADVGIAIGGGTDVAVESADIILVKNNLNDVVAVITLAKATTRKMIQNLLWATGYNVIAIPLAAGVLFRYGILLSPALGAVLMSVSTVVVAINARFLKMTATNRL